MTALPHTGRCALCHCPAALDAPEPDGLCGVCLVRLKSSDAVGGCVILAVVFGAALVAGVAVQIVIEGMA